MKTLLITIMLSASLMASAAVYDSNTPIPVGPINEMSYSPQATHFSVWSPNATAAKVNLYAKDLGGKAEASFNLTKQEDGTWTATVPGDKKGLFYTFQVQVDGKWLAETPGIFAKAVGTNGQRAQILCLKSTNPEGWCKDHAPALAGKKDIILYEMHHRDMSVDPSSGIQNKGKFLAMTEEGTKNPDGLSTGLDHLKQLGITHVHLLPSYDFGSIDETTGLSLGGGGREQKTSYNWGYDPVNYNAPEGSYSTNAADPAKRITEFKKMVMAMHKAGLRVVMDVVYNHVFDLEQSQFNKTAPGYFFRWVDKDGKPADYNPSSLNSKPSAIQPSNGSGCGNETASNMPMMRKYMVESVLYWMKEYHIDGFRFDLMGIHDIETMNAIREAAELVDPNVFIYGEGWAAGAPAYPADKLAMKASAAKLGGVAAFGDEMRDGLRGGWAGGDEQGAFVIGEPGNEESVKFGIVGAIKHPGIDYSKVNCSKEPWADEPTQMIAYVSCHDDMCLADRLKCSYSAKLKKQNKLPQPSARLSRLPAARTLNPQLAKLQKLAETAVLTSQGVPFIWCGDEIMRDRHGVHNCFASPDSINAIDWTLKTKHQDVFDYVSTLVSMRKAHPAFHMGCAEKVRENLSFIPVKQKNVIAYTLNGKAVGDSWNDIVVVLNSNMTAVSVPVAKGNYTVVVADGKADMKGLSKVNGATVKVAPQSALIMFK